jgi:Tol biopolymer transport system component
MKRLLSIGIVLLSIATLSAQTIAVEKSYRLMDQQGFHPQFNANGSMLAFTTESYTGLDVYNVSNNSVVRVSEDPGAGFQPVFSKSSDKVFFKNIIYENRLRKEGIKSYEFNNNKKVTMLEPRRIIKQPQAFENGILIYADARLLKATFGKTKTPVTDYVWSDGSNLNIYRDNKIQRLNPVGDANGYIWASLSPNGKMILFTAAGTGTFVCDLNGKIIAKLGYLNAPVWYNDNLVVGMQDKDNGEYVTESKILMKSIDGKVEKVLSTPNQIAMYPTTAASAKKVAYNTVKGEIYVVELK